MTIQVPNGRAAYHDQDVWMNPLQTPLLVFGTCSEADFPEYEQYFNET